MLVDIAGSLLSLAHSIFGPGICPGDWVWATSTAGALIALFPMLGTLTIALVRKGTGNLYNGVTNGVFGTIGVLTALLVPWLLMNGVSAVFSEAYGGRPSGLDAGQARTLDNKFCWLQGSQKQYLGGRATVYEVLFHPFQGTPVLILHLCGLVVLPGVCLLFVLLQARAALRRGPKWPGRLVWVPFAVMALLSVGLESNTALHLWLGFLPISVLGLVPVLLVGPPSWHVIEQRYQHDPQSGPIPLQHAPMPPQPSQPYAPQQPVRRPMNQGYQQPTPMQMPRTPPPPMRPTVREPEPDRQALAKLAADPGPLPFGPKPPPPDPDAPTVASPSSSRFRKIRALGRGGFGTVWLCRDTQLDRTVAVKMAHAPDAETEERMLREARALAAVHHPNCVRVYDIVSDVDGLGIVMEYIDGQPLADRVLTGGALDDVAAARLWLSMASALAAAHAKGVLHRDVKPSNVIIDKEGVAHLIDFGIARSKGDSTLTATGMMVGTPDFLASETASGQGATPASDAWQLAATVSYALTGQPPRGVRDNAIAALMAAAKAEPLTQLPQRSAHRALLTASLDPDPNRRPTLTAIVREMSDWLERHGHDEDGPVTQIVKREDVERTRPI